LGRAYQKGAETAGREVTFVAFSALAFDPILHNGNRTVQPREPELATAYAALAARDRLVIVFPLWCGDMPSLLKGFVERILQPDLIEREQTKHAMNWSIFATHGHRDGNAGFDLPVLVSRLYIEAAHAEHSEFHRDQAVRHTLLGMTGTAKPERRKDRLRELRQLGEQAA
jgi:putative NADPH-quinone reductase